MVLSPRVCTGRPRPSCHRRRSRTRNYHLLLGLPFTKKYLSQRSHQRRQVELPSYQIPPRHLHPFRTQCRSRSRIERRNVRLRKVKHPGDGLIQSIKPSCWVSRPTGASGRRLLRTSRLGLRRRCARTRRSTLPSSSDTKMRGLRCNHPTWKALLSQLLLPVVSTNRAASTNPSRCKPMSRESSLNPSR